MAKTGKSTRYFIYALVFENNPVYIGMTTSIAKRTQQHRLSGKIFSSVYIIYSYKDKNLALAAERYLIKFISAFGKDCYNTQDFFGLYYKIENQNNG